MYIHACIHAWVVMGEMVLVLEEEDEEVEALLLSFLRTIQHVCGSLASWM